MCPRCIHSGTSFLFTTGKCHSVFTLSPWTSEAVLPSAHCKQPRHKRHVRCLRAHVFASLGYLCRDRNARSCGGSTLNFLGDLPCYFHMAAPFCIPSRSAQVSLPSSPCPRHRRRAFPTTAVLVGGKWCPPVFRLALPAWPLRTSAFHTLWPVLSSLEKCLFRFLLGFCVFLAVARTCRGTELGLRV